MNLEKAKQTAETRLHNRLKRPEDENVKDNAQLRYLTSTSKKNPLYLYIYILLIIFIYKGFYFIIYTSIYNEINNVIK